MLCIITEVLLNTFYLNNNKFNVNTYWFITCSILISISFSHDGRSRLSK